MSNAPSQPHSPHPGVGGHTGQVSRHAVRGACVCLVHSHGAASKAFGPHVQWQSVNQAVLHFIVTCEAVIPEGLDSAAHAVLYSAAHHRNWHVPGPTA